jgi:hypothetical protein
MSIGPIAKVDTLTASIDLDLGRRLRWGKGLVLEFIVIDSLQSSRWRIVLALSKGFNRISHTEETNHDGSEVILQVADPKGKLVTVFRLKDLHVRVDGQIYSVSKVPPLAPNVAQVYTLTCKIRTIRPTGGFDNSR